MHLTRSVLVDARSPPITWRDLLLLRAGQAQALGQVAVVPHAARALPLPKVWLRLPRPGRMAGGRSGFLYAAMLAVYEAMTSILAYELIQTRKRTP